MFRRALLEKYYNGKNIINWNIKYIKNYKLKYTYIIIFYCATVATKSSVLQLAISELYETLQFLLYLD